MKHGLETLFVSVVLDFYLTLRFYLNQEGNLIVIFLNRLKLDSLISKNNWNSPGVVITRKKRNGNGKHSGQCYYMAWEYVSPSKWYIQFKTFFLEKYEIGKQGFPLKIFRSYRYPNWLIIR